MTLNSCATLSAALHLDTDRGRVWSMEQRSREVDGGQVRDGIKHFEMGCVNEKERRRKQSAKSFTE